MSVQVAPALWQFHRITFLAEWMYDVHVQQEFSIGLYSQVWVLLFYQ